MILKSLLVFLLFMRLGDSKPVIQVGDEAPTFSLPTLDHKYVTLRDFCGRELRKPWKNKTKYVVVVSFFATWCKPCMAEIPHLEKLSKDFKDLPVKFYLIDVGEDNNTVATFLKNKDINLPILLDRYQKTAEKYDALTLPRLFVLDKNGIVRKEQKGFSDADAFEKEMIELLMSLIDDES